MELTAIKVKIGLKSDGSAKYPDFNTLPVLKGIDWSMFVDREGLGWHYDKTSGHKEETIDSPRGQQWGVLVVPEQFAIEAVAAFPGECIRLTETELSMFYDNKAHWHEPDEVIDQKIVDGLRDTLGLMEKVGANQTQIDNIKVKIRKAIDPNDPEPGIKKNFRKKWADMKSSANVTIKNPV